MIPSIFGVESGRQQLIQLQLDASAGVWEMLEWYAFNDDLGTVAISNGVDGAFDSNGVVLARVDLSAAGMDDLVTYRIPTIATFPGSVLVHVDISGQPVVHFVWPESISQGIAMLEEDVVVKHPSVLVPTQRKGVFLFWSVLGHRAKE